MTKLYKNRRPYKPRELHGLARGADGKITALYQTWRQMRARCNRPSHERYAYYGGRGIRVCPEWDESYIAFHNDMAPHPGKGWSLDRIDPDGDYSRANCRWANTTAQGRNRRNVAMSLVFARELRAEYASSGMSCSALARKHGLNIGALHHILKNRQWKEGVEKTLRPKTTKKVVARTSYSVGTDGKITPVYRAWSSMRNRCNNSKNAAYPRYGGRGIKVCARWNTSFTAFRDDMGPHPGAGWSLDRIDVDGDYEPANCRWATATTQSRNRRNIIRKQTFKESAG